MKTCYYEILELDNQCEASDIKQAYRRQALQWHPDKHPTATQKENDEVKLKFQLIQEAYEVLSDPQERAWYDGHKAEILHGCDSVGESGEDTEGVNLWPYFQRSSFEKFDDGPKGFYTVFSFVFEEVSKIEEKYGKGGDESKFKKKKLRSRQNESDDECRYVPLPKFGNSKSSWEDLRSFYSSWESFSTVRPCHHASLWKVKEATDRYSRRILESENKRSRKDARKEYSELVRQLVAHVKKRDERVREMTTATLKQQQAKAEEAARQKVQAEKDRVVAREIAKEEERLRWLKLDAVKKDSRLCGQSFVGEESSDDALDVSDDEVFYCAPCNKMFKSENQLAVHERSKKHVKAAQSLGATNAPKETPLAERGEAGKGEQEDSENKAAENIEGDEGDDGDKVEEELTSNGEEESSGEEEESNKEDSDDDDDDDGDDDGEPDCTSEKGATQSEEDLASVSSTDTQTLRPLIVSGIRSGVSDTESDDDKVETSHENVGETHSKGASQPNENDEEPLNEGGGRRRRRRRKDNQGQESAANSRGGKDESKTTTTDQSRADTQNKNTPTEKKQKQFSRTNNNNNASDGNKPGAKQANVYACKVCSVKFGTRNQLFTHLKATGHATVVNNNTKNTTKV